MLFDDHFKIDANFKIWTISSTFNDSIMRFIRSIANVATRHSICVCVFKSCKSSKS